MTILYKNDQFKNLILDLNIQAQLYERGIDSNGDKLISPYARGSEVYAPMTIAIKTIKGQPTDRVTLKDTGEFYRSFRLVLHTNGDLEIVADTDKGDNDLAEVWGEDILGLTDENLQKVIDLAREILQEEILKIILGTDQQQTAA